MEHITQIGNILTYQFSGYSNDVFFLIAGIVFILIYFLKSPFYWLKLKKFPASRKIALVIGIIFIILGSAEIFQDTTKKIVFDKSQQKLFVITASRFIEKDRQAYDLNKIESITITKGQETRNDYVYILEVQFDKDESLLIAKNVENISYSEFKQHGEQIASFLHIPFKLINN